MKFVAVNEKGSKEAEGESEQDFLDEIAQIYQEGLKFHKNDLIEKASANYEKVVLHCRQNEGLVVKAL